LCELRSEQEEGRAQEEREGPGKGSSSLVDRYAEKLLLDVLRRASDAGMKGQGGYKKQVYSQVVVELQATAGFKLSADQAANKVDYFKRKWRAWMVLVENSGFGFDPVTGLHTAPDQLSGKALIKRFYPESTLIAPSGPAVKFIPLEGILAGVIYKVVSSALS
ncbi:hypothetical protein B0T24DRAFT_712273, partial [Lasiosphaeria ovina]